MKVQAGTTKPVNPYDLRAEDISRALGLLERIYDTRNRTLSNALHIPTTIDKTELDWLASVGLPPQQLVTSTHDKAIQTVLAAKATTSITQSAQAFVASIDRSEAPHGCLLEASLLAHTMPEHAHNDAKACSVCGLTGTFTRDLTEEFLRWHRMGSGIPGSIPWALLALERDHNRQPSEHAIALLAHVLATLDSLAATARAMEAVAAVQALGFEKQPAQSIIETLAFAGVLEALPHVGLTTRFVSFREREVRPNVRVEFDAPLGFWKGSHGVQWNNVQTLFGRTKHTPLPPLEKAQSVATTEKPKKGKKTAGKSLARRPAQGGDLWALPFREDSWVLVYIWSVDTTKARLYGLAEFVGELVPEVPSQTPTGLHTRPRYDGRWQYWTSGLEKTPGAVLLAEKIEPPITNAPAPSRVASGSGKDLLYQASSCYSGVG